VGAWGIDTQWARMLAYITGLVDQELLLRTEYLAAENRILKAQLKGCTSGDDEEKADQERCFRVPRDALHVLPRGRSDSRPLFWTQTLTLCRCLRQRYGVPFQPGFTSLAIPRYQLGKEQQRTANQNRFRLAFSFRLSIIKGSPLT